MATLMTNINGNPNIGIYMFTTDKYLLIGREVQKRKAKKIGEVLGLEPIQATIGGTSLIGVFINGDNHKLIVPSIISNDELSFLEDNLSVKIKVLNTNLTALNNNLLIGKRIIASPEFKQREIEEIARFFGKEVYKKSVGKTHVPGTLIRINGKKAAISNLLTKKDEEMIKSLLEVETERITVNMGNPFISSAIIVNRNGLIIGDSTGGAEAAMIEQALMR